MKSFLAVALIAGFVAAEVPSHSYLPPPPRGYQSSSPPSVIAARTLDPDHHNGDHYNGDHGAASTRSSPQPVGQEYSTVVPQSRFNDEQGYDQNAAGYTRNALEDVNSTVSYDADESYKPQIYSSDDTQSAGYDNNANNVRSSTNYEPYGVRSNGYQGNEQDGGRNQNGVRNSRSNRFN